MYAGGAHIPLPDDLDVEALALGGEPEPSSSSSRAPARKRQRADTGGERRRHAHALPRRFWVCADAGDDKVCLGLVTLISVRPLSDLHITPVVAEQMDELRIADPARALAWVLDACQTVRLPEPLNFGKSSAKRWAGITTLNGDISQACIAAHRNYAIPVRSMQVIVLPTPAARRILEPDFHVFVSPSSWSRHAHVVVSAAAGSEDAVVPHDDGALALAPAQPATAGIASNFRNSLRPVSGGIEFKVSVIIQALRLMWVLRDSRRTSISEVLRRAWRLSLPPAEAVRLESALAAGDLRVPQASLLRSSCVKLDILLSCYRREQLAKEQRYMFLSTDASPQKGWNIFCARAIWYSWPEGRRPDDLLHLDLAAARTETHLPASSLGIFWGGRPPSVPNRWPRQSLFWYLSFGVRVLPFGVSDVHCCGQGLTAIPSPRHCFGTSPLWW